MVVRVVKAERIHAEMIADRLRHNSPEQIQLTNLGPSQIIGDAIERARYCWTGFWDEEIGCIFGVESTTILTDTAYVWIATTPLVEKHPLVFAKWSRAFIRNLIEEKYEVIMGCVDPQYGRSIDWLKWLGFDIVEIPGVKEHCRFEMRRK